MYNLPVIIKISILLSTIKRPDEQQVCHDYDISILLSTIKRKAFVT